MPRCNFDPILTDVFAGAFDDAFNLLTIANPFYATLGSQVNLRFQLANWFLVNSHLVEHGRSHLTAAAVDAICPQPFRASPWRNYRGRKARSGPLWHLADLAVQLTDVRFRR